MSLSTILRVTMETQQRHFFRINVEITICNVEITIYIVVGYRNSLHSKTELFWRRNLAGNKKTYLGLHAKFPKFLSHFKQVWIFIKLSSRVSASASVSVSSVSVNVKSETVIV
jgi:hypothetical protein